MVHDNNIVCERIANKPTMNIKYILLGMLTFHTHTHAKTISYIKMYLKPTKWQWPNKAPIRNINSIKNNLICNWDIRQKECLSLGE